MLLALLILILIVAIVVIYFVATKNSISKSANQVDEAYSTMDVYLKKRHDLIPNLVNTAKGYANYESGTLEQIARANSLAESANTMEEVLKQENKIDNASSKLIALAQAYPELKANTNFVNLMNQLEKIEEDIANSRKYYNASVREYNNKITTFPGKSMAGSAKKKPYYQVDSEKERQNVNVEF